ncbi:hypothetical protein BD770DRAFT_442607 [Pilaira anomala]|nr:hypothetical protein BD770DRAFT_442607 [Pilaira anomala]
MKFSIIATLIFFALFTVTTHALPVESSITQVNDQGTVVNHISGSGAIAVSSVKSTHVVIERRRANIDDAVFY